MLTMASGEVSPETELDAILGQLCALETQIDRELSGRAAAKSVVSADLSVQSSNGSRTDSPDNDSAYSDSLSMQSSSGSGAVTSADPSQTSQTPTAEQPPSLPTSNDHPKDVQLFVKVFTADNSAKSLLADEHMSVSVICRQLAEKNHIVMDPKCSIVEHLPELYLERFYEDNESLVENVLLWTRDSSNRLYFMEKEEKYDLFVNPERYLLGVDSSERGAHMDDEAKSNLVDEFFTGGVPVPEVEGHLYLKSDGKKAWKKHFFVLRASGLYYCPKGKSKSSKDLVCLTTFEMNNVYYGVGWRKKYKAPNDFGFAIKHPQIQAKNSKYIKYLCADSDRELRLWTTGIRIAKYGRQLKDNYDNITRDIVEADLDSLANRRSFSVCSMTRSIPLSPTSPISTTAPIGNGCVTHEAERPCMRTTSITIAANNSNTWQRISRHDSLRSSSTCSSSGCMSEKGSNSSTPTMEQLAFEADFPVGTIKRKPSVLQPKIPLTTTTRTLALLSDDALVKMNSSDSEDEDNGHQRQWGTLRNGTLRRSATDERLKNRVYEPLREQLFHNQNNCQNNYNVNERPIVQCTYDRCSDDELPLPPPPTVLQPSLSKLSLNLPPPPPDVLDSPTQSVDVYDQVNTTPVHRQNSRRVPPPPPPKRSESTSRSDARSPDADNEEANRQWGSLRTGSMRRSATDERLKNMQNAVYEPLKEQRFYNQSNCQNDMNFQVNDKPKPLPVNCTYEAERLVDELPLPPPPQVLRPSLSKTNLNSLPPPPADLMDLAPEFFMEIQRVMEKKWKVAQALSTNLTATPNQILGFHDPKYLPPKADQPIYGNHMYDTYDVLPNQRPMKSVTICEDISRTPAHRQSRRRMPPPPPPKRSESTLLSQRPVAMSGMSAMSGMWCRQFPK